MHTGWSALFNYAYRHETLIHSLVHVVRPCRRSKKQSIDCDLGIPVLNDACLVQTIDNGYMYICMHVAAGYIVHCGKIDSDINMYSLCTMHG